MSAVSRDSSGGINIIDLANIHSSTIMPSDTPAMTVIDPQNAAMAAIRILALTDKKLKKQIAEHINEIKESF